MARLGDDIHLIVCVIVFYFESLDLFVSENGLVISMLRF